MKDKLLICFKYFLYAAGVILLVLLSFGFVLAMDWPWWVGVFVVLVLLGLLVGALFLNKLLARRREQHFVQQVIEQDDAQLQKLPSHEQGQLKELQQSWKEAVETLRRSHLKKQGNPLYVLPWYLVMGESGSGKSTAINSARLSSPFSEVLQRSGVSGTRNCDWWFFDEAILIDTAGRYSIPVDSARDNEEWQKFLSLLVKYRKREPIHGLIITVAADKLLKGSREELENDGKQMRRRMDELMRVLGIKFPVYVLVTKCDLVQGMTRFSDLLPEKSLEQAMGACNGELTPDIPGFLERVRSGVAQRLKDLRILLLHQPERAVTDPGVLLFPDEMQALQPGLAVFMRAAFEANRYQDTPLLRGVYFSSGRQEGTPFSHFLGDLGLIAEQEVLPGTNRGLFLHDFFAKILPADRGLLAPTTRSMQWQSLTRNLGLTSWVLIGTALCGLLSYSFVKNMSAIREATSVVAKSPDLTGNFVTDLATMDRFHSMILDVERKNREWWIPRFGLNESRRVEMELKAKYCRLFQERFLLSLDRNMGASVAAFSAATPDEVSGRYLMHLARRINLLKARIGGAGLEALQGKPLPSYLVSALPQVDDAASGKKFGAQYLNYLVWRGNQEELGKELYQLQALLKQVAAVKEGSLAWTLEIANREEPGAAISVRSFWGGSREVAGEPVILPAFTRKGRAHVDQLMAEIIAAHPEPELLERERAAFYNWYRGACYASWQRFASWFHRGEERLNGVREWQSVAAVMATEQGPYLGFLKKAALELEAFGTAEGLPPWVAQIFKYQLLKTAGPAGAAAAGNAAAAAGQADRMADRLGKLVGKDAPDAQTAAYQATSAKALQGYLAALAQIAPAAKSRSLSQQMAQQVFTEDPAVSNSPFYKAADAVQRVSELVSGGGGDETFNRLISSPITFYGTFVRMETACSLQRQWEEKVLQELQGATDPATLTYLLGKDGPVWKYVSESANPFIGWTPGRGYYSKSALGGSIPFEPGFYTFLTKGAKAKVAIAAAAAAPPKQNYNVTVKGLPTDANADSRVKPQGTRLELQCASGPQVMDNLNYPVSKTFAWSPESCSDVVFQIDVGDAVLTRRYTGAQGFPEFLHDFPGGRHTFYPKDFPREQQALERMGVRYIRVNYQLFGGHDIQAGAGTAKSAQPGQVPVKITQCWD